MSLGYGLGLMAHEQGGEWTPPSLTGLEIWVETDISTLFQDSAKTTPVTADGDPVGAWADKSGNVNDFLITSVPDKRPTYKTDYIRGNGTDEYIEQVWTNATEVMWGISIIPRQMANEQGVVGSSSSAGGPSNTPYILINSSTTQLRVFGNAAYRFFRNTSVGDEVTFVVRITQPASNFLMDCWIDGVKETQVDLGVTVGVVGFLHLFLGFNDEGQFDIPAFIMAHGNYSDAEAEDLATYLGSTLPSA